MTQNRLFTLAPEVMHLHATFVGGQGWHLSVVVRRQADSWDGAYRADYHHLDSGELADVMSAEVERQLGIV